jgi:histidinol phosphatase-like enzyme
MSEKTIYATFVVVVANVGGIKRGTHTKNKSKNVHDKKCELFSKNINF